jgi:hypothetical protein
MYYLYKVVVRHSELPSLNTQKKVLNYRGAIQKK